MCVCVSLCFRWLKPPNHIAFETKGISHWDCVSENKYERDRERETESRIKENPTGGFVWSEIKVGPSDGGGGGGGGANNRMFFFYFSTRIKVRRTYVSKHV